MAEPDFTPAWLAGLLDAHGAALVLYARAWCTSPEDVVQEAFAKLVTERTRPDDAVAWLYRVVRNGAISASRGDRRRRLREQRTATSEVWFTDASCALDAVEATDALSSLPVELREVVVARIWGGLTFSEIGELTGSSTSTAQRRYEQGLRELEQRLEKPCETNPRPKR